MGAGLPEFDVRVIRKKGIPVGHLKFLVSDFLNRQKLSQVSGDVDPELTIDKSEV